MSEFRWDPLKSTWVITADHRSRSPRDFFLDRQKVQVGACPFCPGHEAKTLPEVFALRPGGVPANGPGWQVRVVPNKFPLLRIEGELTRYSPINPGKADFFSQLSLSTKEPLGPIQPDLAAWLMMCRVWGRRLFTSI